MKSLKHNLKAVDFFCGGGGMSCGLRKSGVRVVAGIDNDPKCQETYKANHPDAEFILADIKEMEPGELAMRAKVRRNDDAMIFIGCSPCQYWSIIQGSVNDERKKRSRESRNLLGDFLDFVNYYRPGFVVVENVRGMERHPEDSKLAHLLDFFAANGYTCRKGVLALSDFGVPQTRRRFVLVASRVLEDISLPQPKKERSLPTVRTAFDTAGLPKIKAGECDTKDKLHRSPSLSETNIKRLSVTKAGEGRWNWIKSEALLIDAYRGKEASFFRKNYGRMAWDKPAPTITTKFYAVSCGQFAHPTENRAISLREGAILQTFPKSYKFKTEDFATTARIIGNAVPPKFAKALGKSIVKQVKNGGKSKTAQLPLIR